MKMKRLVVQSLGHLPRIDEDEDEAGVGRYVYGAHQAPERAAERPPKGATDE
jgi:hypothetical protein